MKKTYEWIWLSLLLLCPLVLWILPSSFFDDTGVITCPSRLLLGIECFGCGMTRAIMHLHHFNIEEAFYYNYGSLFIYPALIVIWFIWVKASLTRLEYLGQS